MYDSKFICTYSFYDPVLRKHHSDIPFDLDDVSDFEELSELLYQGEMLKVFKIEDFNIIGSNDAIKAKITILFNMLTGHSKMVECMRKTAAFMLNDDLELESDEIEPFLFTNPKGSNCAKLTPASPWICASTL